LFWLVASALVLLAAVAAVWWADRTPEPSLPVPQAVQQPPTPAPVYAGREACIECHAEQDRLWQGSHHDLAMQEAGRATVLGDFDNRTFDWNGVVSRFYKQDGRFMVQTDGPDGTLQDYPVKYTFGVSPLQQYLVEFPGGRLQALSIVWDSRPVQDGGQRWFHLYPDETVTHEDVLHWTRDSQNWNSRCAACHSTNLQKNYRPEDGSYDTRWSEIDVSCEACHGPASRHIDWAKKTPGSEIFAETQGLVVDLGERADSHWRIDPQTGNAVRSRPREQDTEIEVCAPCHSRRSAISDDYVPGDPLLDHYRPALLNADLYFSDGQIRDEVYIYGSFVQSRMYHAGVTCSDCHEPHSLRLRMPGNEVCLQCHAAEKYAAASHHFHAPDSAGAACADCHMPARTYMVVDPRRDHSLRIPRPDLSVALGVPNACNNCHADKTPEWAAARVEAWYGHVPGGYQRFAGALQAGRAGDPAAARLLADLIRDPHTPDIARATALAENGAYLGPQNLDLVSTGLWHDNPLVRTATVGMLEQTPAGLRAQLLAPMLEDSSRAVRIEAARVLAGLPVGDSDIKLRARRERGVQEYIQAQNINAERPEAQVNLGLLYSQLGQPDKAEAAYRTAMALSPVFVPAYVNLADLYRALGSDEQGEKVLRQALSEVSDIAEVHYALGLLLVRQKQLDTAIDELKKASSLAGNVARYVYTYAVALNAAGRPGEAILTLRDAHDRHPNDTDILVALVAFNREQGNADAADSWQRKLEALSTRR
jgi:tetratricopeptide (TPR) repeat protein